MESSLPNPSERFNIAAACLDRWAASEPGDRPAIRDADGVLTYRQLRESVDRLANGLKAQGLGRGDRFLIRLSGGVHFYSSFLAGLKLGAVAIPTPELLRKRELRHIIDTAGVRLVITSHELAEPIRNLRRELSTLEEVICLGGSESSEVDLEELIAGADPHFQAVDTHKDDPAFVLFSSGTTGVAKGIAHAHRAFNIAAGDPVGREGMGLQSSDVVLHPHDPAWSYSLGCGFLFPMMEGASIVSSTTRIPPRDILRWVENYSVSILACVPTFYRAILADQDVETGVDLSSLRHCLSAGEPLTSSTYDEWLARMKSPILDHIGQGETSMFCANLPGGRVVPGSIGKPLTGYEVAIVDDEANEVVGEIGHLVISQDNPGLFYDYLNMPEKWAATHKNGWYYTGDLARRDEDGLFWYVSRSDDLITSRGYLISPAEVEDALVEHPTILEAGVVGHPHEQWGEVVTAYVALQPGVEASSELEDVLANHVREQLAPFKTPKKWVFPEELPKTSTGKILRRMLRERGGEPENSTSPTKD